MIAYDIISFSLFGSSVLQQEKLKKQLATLETKARQQSVKCSKPQSLVPSDAGFCGFLLLGISGALPKPNLEPEFRTW